MDEGEMSSSSPSSLKIYGRWDSWPQGHESGRTGHVPHRLQHLGERAAHLTRPELGLGAGVADEQALRV